MEEKEEIIISEEGIAKDISLIEEKKDVPNKEEITNKKPYTWVPSLYFTEGLPYIIITALAVVFYKQMGFNNTDAAYFTSWLYLPWVIKPFWSPFVDMFKTKRWWVLAMQLFMGAGFAGIGLMLMEGSSHFFAKSIILFWLIAFSSATHDIAADGFYILSLNSHEQSFYVGIRNTFYRVSVIFGQGGLLLFVGFLEESFESISMAWGCTFLLAGGLICILRLYHGIALPKPSSDTSAYDNPGVVLYHTLRKYFFNHWVLYFILLVATTITVRMCMEGNETLKFTHKVLVYLHIASVIVGIWFGIKKLRKESSTTSVQDFDVLQTFFRTFYKFINKKGFVLALSFILLFRLGEAQLGKMTSLFMIDTLEAGGLGLTTKDIGIIYGTFGVGALTLGGLFGGWLVSRDGLKKWFYPMVISMNVPNLAYVAMAYLQIQNKIVITSLVCIEQLGYGFGYTAFTLYLIYFSRGMYKTSYYAICTGFMALGMMLPGFVAGWIQEHIGYSNFFIWVCICTIPGFIIARFLPFNENFGKKE